MGLGSAHERHGGGSGDTHHDATQVTSRPKLEKAGDPFKQLGHEGKEALHGVDASFRRESVATEYERAQALWGDDFGDTPDTWHDETALGTPVVQLDFLNVPPTPQVDADIHRIDARGRDIGERPPAALDDRADPEREEQAELERMGNEWLDALAGDLMSTGLFAAQAVPAPAADFGMELGQYLKGAGAGGAGSFDFSIEFRSLGEIDGHVSFGRNDHVDIELRPRSAAVRQLLQEHRSQVERAAGSESGFDLTLMIV